MGALHSAGALFPSLSTDPALHAEVGTAVQGMLTSACRPHHTALASRETTLVSIWKKNPRAQICFLHLLGPKNRFENFLSSGSVVFLVLSKFG